MTADRIVLYGSLMRGLGAMDKLALAHHLEFEGPALIPGELFELGAYPGLRRGQGRVVGELYAILDPEVLLELDDFEGVVPDRPTKSLYLRERIQLIEPTDAQVWVYLYNRRPAPDKRIAGGDWRLHLDNRVGR